MRILYTILFYLALPFIFLRLLWRSSRIPGYRKHWMERLGFFPQRLQKSIWIHAVSVGESIAVSPLIKALQKEFPTSPLLITNMTPTGRASVKKIFGDEVTQAYLPYDLPGAVTRFLNRFNPKVAIIIETELWPNLFASCKKRNIPIIVMNARLSEKSQKGYAHIPTLTRDMFLAIYRLAAAANADAERFIQLGLAKEKAIVTGNIKFDLTLPADLPSKSTLLHQTLGENRRIWIAASTHPGEDEIILASHRLVKEKFPNALLVLVPRHPDRFETIAALCAKQGFNVVRRSNEDECGAETDVYLGDTMGELLLMYSVADAAWVGGSFVKIGGHNLLEPAILKKPVLSGPVLYNFAEISQLLLEKSGLLIVQNAETLAEALIRLFSNPDLSKTMGENAYQVIAANRGVLQRQLALVKSVF